MQAPSEAEAQCAALCKAGTVYAMASEDMDSLTFATPRLTRNLLSPASAKMPVTEYEYDKVLRRLESMLSVSRQGQGTSFSRPCHCNPAAVQHQVTGQQASEQGSMAVCHGGRSGCCAAISDTHDAGRCPLCRWSRGWASRATSSWMCASCAAATTRAPYAASGRCAPCSWCRSTVRLNAWGVLFLSGIT